jgi:hypothetical protein
MMSPKSKVQSPKSKGFCLLISGFLFLALGIRSAEAFRLNLNILTNPVPAAAASFGWNCTSLGNTNLFAVAASSMPIGGVSGVGQTYLYDMHGALLMTITNPIYNAAGHFGNALCSVGATNQFIIAAYNQPFGTTNYSGMLYIYDTTGTQIQAITNPSPATNAYFGFSVAAVGANQFVVGADSYPIGSKIQVGQAYLYTNSTYNTWTLAQTITNPTPFQGDCFGSAIACVNTNQILIGAKGKTNLGLASGVCFLYDNTGANLIATIPEPSAGGADNFGYAVAGVGTSGFVVGAWSRASSAGAAYYYTNNVLAQTLNGSASSYFGQCVAGWTNQNWFLVGAPRVNPGSFANAGAAYLYNAGTLTQTITNPNPVASDLSQFGAYMAAPVGYYSGQFVIASYSKTYGGFSSCGQAYLYTIKKMPPPFL